MDEQPKAKRKYDTTAARLSDAKLRNLKAVGFHADGHGLGVQITATGARSWLYRFSLRGRAREMGLGPLELVSLAQARALALEARKLVHSGIDPIENRKARDSAAAVAQAHRMTFDECVDAFIAAHAPGWRNAKHQSQWRNTLAQYATPVFGALPVDAVDTALVMKALEPIWSEKPETASRVRGRVESILSWATVRGYRAGANPATWRNHLDKLLPKRSKVRAVRHHSALPYGQMHSFMRALREQQQNSVAAIALEVCILTATRTSEVLNAEWEEFGNLDRAEWVIPASRMKAGREHRVPLPSRVVELLKRVATVNNGRWPFSDNPKKPLSSMAMLMLLRRMKYEGVTVHGFRSTFRTWASERTSFPSDVCEAALAHTVRDAVKAAYMRTEFFDQRRKLMDAWAKFIEVKPAAKADNVVVMRQGKA